ncbi:cell growth-regulating nucleolar protein isoform X2 [Brachyhypopomus gauderio]|uniref:cell growth-regulating nucleolar protein isoform X2 n=1 Tax=Brachyhypopomus gauderio TaxID=698409 RepID=UPI004042F16E
MVFFTCNACGESLKKAQVDKHVNVCRACRVLSCIDCGKDFLGEDYKNHVRCVSEDQKYGGKAHEAKANKGDVKQQQWIQRIQEATNKPGIEPKLKEVLSQVSSYQNIPRKKAKFQDQVWEIFSANINSQQPETKPEPEKNKASYPLPPPRPPQTLQQELEEETSQKKKNKRERKEERQKKNTKKPKVYSSKEDENEKGRNGEIDSDKRQKKKRKKEVEENGEDRQHVEEKLTNQPKKLKREECEGGTNMEEDEDEEEGSSSKGKFNWRGTMKAILRQVPDEGLALKRLRKKVLAAYYSFHEDGNYKSEEELYSMFNKKLNCPRFKILKDKVRLVK